MHAGQMNSSVEGPKDVRKQINSASLIQPHALGSSGTESE